MVNWHSAHRRFSHTVANPRPAPTVDQDGQLRAECDAMLALLDPERRGRRYRDWDIEHVAARVVELRGRPMRRIRLDLPPSLPCGLCLSTADGGVIIVSPADNGVRGELAELHEFCHLLFDDELPVADDVEAVAPGQGSPAIPVTDETLTVLRTLLPDLPDAMLRNLRGRTTYTTYAEQRAETLATMVAARLMARRPYQRSDQHTPTQTVMAATFAVPDPPPDTRT